jgi:polysaccharide biosynthesis protein PelF
MAAQATAARACNGPGGHPTHRADRVTTSPLRVLMVCEATYPFHWGGLSTWCHGLMSELAEVSFDVLAICDSPQAQPKFDLPPSVASYRSVPLWGLRTARELSPAAPARDTRRRRRSTNEETLAAGFLPSFEIFLGQILDEERDDDAFAQSLHHMYGFLQEHDFDATFRSRPVWETLCRNAERRFPPAANARGYMDTRLSVAELTAAGQWLYHWLFPLARPLPPVDIAHATMAGLCSMVGVVAKLEHGAGLLLSEHGIYLRECYLAEHRSRGSLFGKLLKLGFARRMTELAYAFADRVAPCCDYNHRWERRMGVDAGRIRTAYYGADADRFVPVERPASDAPVVAWAGRIDPLKDVETLLRAAAVVRDSRPEIRFRLFGGAPPGNEEYHARCLDLYDELRLRESVTFEGFTPDTAAVYAECDLVVLSSISEGFPYATLEAMLCGRPVVATAVGGLAEQVTEDCGRIVPPRDPRALGEAILDLLADEERRTRLALAARERSVSLFSMDRFRATHRMIYAETLASARGHNMLRETPSDGRAISDAEPLLA